MVPADSRRIPRVPRYSGYRYAAFRFTYWTITVYGHIFQSVLFTICIQCRGPTTPATPCDATGLGCSPFARHYWGNHYLFSLPAGTKMFLDWLIYNKPLEYAQLVFGGDLERFVQGVSEHQLMD